MTELHMIRLRLQLPRLMELARQQRMPLYDLDTGYLAHIGLSALFGAAAPKPFAIQSDLRPPLLGDPDVPPRELVVLGYAPVAHAALRSQIGAEARALLADGSLDSHALPAELPRGARFRFTVRGCPTVRSKRQGDEPRPRDRKGRPRSLEIDAWLAKCLAVGTKAASPDAATVDRAVVYADWLRRAVGSAATLDQIDLVAFSRVPVVRRTQRGPEGTERKSRVSDRPAAVFEGTLTVSDAARFRELLARGVGRHRSFGFGMLLLRPAR